MKDLEKIIDIVKKAGQAILSFYNKEIKVDYKAPDSPLTQADVKSNEILINSLKEFGYGILSEESIDDKTRLDQDRVWIIDPMDGTKDFIDKTGEFTIILGLVEKGEPILGMVYKPLGDVLYYAIKGEGAYRRVGDKEERLRVSDQAELAESKMLSSRFHRSEAEIALADKYEIDINTCGSVLKTCLIAEGKGDFNFNPSDKTWEWDICGAQLILEEAGGTMTDINGGRIKYNKDNPRNVNGYLATNGILHDKIMKEII